MKHTKGPWRRAFRSRGWFVHGNDGSLVASVFGNEIEANAELIAKAPAMYDQLASAHAIMQKFVDKVDRGMARSTETYAEMKEWLDA